MRWTTTEVQSLGRWYANYNRFFGAEVTQELVETDDRVRCVAYDAMAQHLRGVAERAEPKQWWTNYVNSLAQGELWRNRDAR